MSEVKRPAVNYEGLTKEQLIARLKRHDAAPKVGLVWDRECLVGDKALNNDFVVMDHDPKLSCGDGKFDNLVIEGDNYDSLRWLQMTHRGKIQCIYIDPPYNTGAATFAYADNYERSHWLEFMATRLRLAKDLLTDDGVILVSIDDEGRAICDLLLEEVFPGKRVGSFLWKSRIGDNHGGDRFLSVDHEHVLVYANEKFKFRGFEKTFEMYKNPDNDQRGIWRLVPLTASYTRFDFPNLYYPMHDPKTDTYYPCNPDSIWRYASMHRLGDRKVKKTIEELIDDNRVVFPKNKRVQVWNTRAELEAAIETGDVPTLDGVPLLRKDSPNLDFWVGKSVGWGAPQTKLFKNDLKNDRQPVSSWIKPKSDKTQILEGEIRCGYTSEGTADIKKIFGSKVFKFTKPPSLLAALIDNCTQPNSVVLDFFGGSGTTGHAVLAVNKEDGGNRRFIMCSEQNGKNLCSDVLAERLRRVIAGYADVEGTGGNFAYLRARTIDPAEVPYGTKPTGMIDYYQQLATKEKEK